MVPSEEAFLESLGEQCQTVIGDTDSDDAFTLGAILPLTESDGSPDVRGEQRKLAMAHALSQINLLEGVKSRKFRVRICDTQSGWGSGDSDKAKAFAAYLIGSDEGIGAIISGASSDTTAIQTITKPAGILLLSISATAISLTHEDGEQLTWRMVSSDWFQGTVLGEATRSCHQRITPDESPGIGVLGIMNVYGSSMWQVLQSLSGLTPGQLLYYPVEIDKSNLDSMIAEMAGKGHSVVIVVGTTSMAAEVFQYYATSVLSERPVIFLTDSNRNPEFLDLVEQSISLDRVYGTIPGAAEETNTYATFESTFNALEGVEPAQGSFTAHSYDAIYCLALAHAYALGSDDGEINGPALVRGLRALNGDTDEISSFSTHFTQIRSTLLDGGLVNVEGASGPLAFDEFGDLPSQVELWNINDESGAGRRFETIGWIDIGGNEESGFLIENPSIFGELCGGE